MTYIFNNTEISDGDIVTMDVEGNKVIGRVFRHSYIFNNNDIGDGDIVTMNVEGNKAIGRVSRYARPKDGRAGQLYYVIVPDWGHLQMVRLYNVVKYIVAVNDIEDVKQYAVERLANYQR